MRNQIKNVFNSYISELSMLVIVCCMVAINLSFSINGSWTSVGVAASIVSGIVLLFLLIWATYMIVKRRDVKEMPVKPRLIVENCSRILLIYWLYLTGGVVIALIWAAFIIWDGIKSIKEAAGID